VPNQQLRTPSDCFLPILPTGSAYIVMRMCKFVRKNTQLKLRRRRRLL